MLKRSSIYILILTILSLSGCKVAPITETEKPHLPTTFDGINAEMRAEAPELFEEFFPDVLLQGYIKQAIASNHSFRQTIEQIAFAKANQKRAKGAMFPEISAGVGANVRRFGDLTMDGIGNKQANEAIPSTEKKIPDPYSDYIMGVNFSWEPDIYGKQNRKRQATNLRWMATVEATRYAQTLLVAEVATAYFNLIGLDRRTQILKRAIQETSHSLTLTRELKNEGIETQLAVDQFHTRLLMLEGLLLHNQEETKIQEHAFSLLLGVLPFKVERIEFEQVNKLIFPMKTGIPTDLLTNRPDVKKAELELIASKLDVSSARASFYPSLVLGGSGGFNSFDIASWFSAPASAVYNLAAGVTAPIFKQGQIKAMYNDAKTSQRIALSKYHEVALRAYTEVIDCILISEYAMQQLKLKEEEKKIQQRSLQNADELFKLGYIGYLEVLDVVQSYLSAELDYIDITKRVCLNQVLLYRALGGGS